MGKKKNSNKTTNTSKLDNLDNINIIDNKDNKKKKKKDEDIKIKEVSFKDNETIVNEVKLDEIKKEDEKMVVEKKSTPKNHLLVNCFFCLILVVSLVYFGIVILNNRSTINDIINASMITLFTVIYSIACITYRKSKRYITISGILLFLFYILNINNYLSVVRIPISTMPDFSNKSLTTVMEWSSKNNLLVNQDYEYSDMIGEYKIISQSIPSGSILKGIKEFNISVSDGPNPYKEIVVPNMIGWDDERVINFVKENHLSNVNVEFVSNESKENTVIEQSASGNMKRNDELKLTFSYGEEIRYEKVKLIDFTGKSTFEIIFYLKQHHLKHEFDYDFSNKIKRTYGLRQNIKPGTEVKIDDELVKVTISKGPKIKVPDLRKMSVNEITAWAIKNKLKIEYSDTYDDSIKKGDVVSFGYSKGEIIEQGTIIKIVLSRGKLKMKNFKSFNSFRDWADKYEIKYEEKHEFNDDVEIGGIISFSYKEGATIKNGDSITVIISDGKRCSVPDLRNLTKSDAISKLEKAGLNYSFNYRSSNDVAKDRVVSQSISSGSEVSRGTTVYVTISSGKATSSSSSSSNNNSGSGSTSSGNSNPAPQPACNPCTITGLKPVIAENQGNYGAAAAALANAIRNQCPGISVNVSADDGSSGKAAGSFISGFQGGNSTTCSSVSIVLAR